MPEICDNALDDDGDGRIDLNDSDCKCPLKEPVSLIPNPSFEERSCCPQTRSQLACADTWIQASEATTDYIHTCGWMGWPNLPVPLPIPDGEACVGFRNGRFGMEIVPNWKEYAGACLLSPLLAGTRYRFEFHIGFVDFVHSPPTSVVFYGSTDCDNLPFGIGDESFGCPTNGPGWQRLGSVSVSGSNNWIETSITITPPQDIYAIAIGPNCTELMAEEDIYYFFDNLVLDEEAAFEFGISSQDHPCSEDFTLRVPRLDTLSYQWYKNGVALVGETAAELQVQTGSGRYEVLLNGPASCRVTRPYQHIVPTILREVNERICAGDRHTFGDRSIGKSGNYQATFKSIDNCDSTVLLNLEVVSDNIDTVEAFIFDGETYEVGRQRFYRRGQYQVGLSSSIGCDSTVFLDLEYYKVFRPSAFSPNNDGANDYFTFFGDIDLIRIASLRVFDRWGNLVYDGENIAPNDQRAGWDGEVNGRPAPAGVYAYIAQVEMDDGKEHQLSGSVLLMR